MTYTTIISATDLLRHAADGQFVVVDCRHDLAQPQAGAHAYAAGHIPGAQFAHLDRVLSGVKQAGDGSFRGRHPLPDRETLAQDLRGLGISDDTQVVAYDAHGGMFAARLWWLLRWLGHAQVAVLDGGLPAWQAAGGTVTAALPGARTGTLSIRDSLTTTVDAQQVLARLGQADQVIVDARAPDRFRGENETLDPVGGHIPGARNRFFKDNLQADGTFKPAAQLRSEWQPLVGEPASAVMQCGSGVTACHNLLALEVAGLTGAALYGGSWSEWCADTSRPVTTGAEA